MGCHVYDDTRLGAPIASATIGTGGSGAQGASVDGAGRGASMGSAGAGRNANDPTKTASSSGGNDAAACEPGGECWWWTTSSEGCRSDAAPTLDARPALMTSPVSATPPLSPDSSSDIDPDNPPDIYLGWTSMHFSSAVEQSDSTSLPQAAFGLDLDGLCTNSKTCPSGHNAPCRSRSKELPYDGDDCRDNAFANLMAIAGMIPQLTEQFGLDEDALNCGLKRGSYNMLMRVRGYNGRMDDPEVRVDWYTSPGLEKLPSWNCKDTDFHQAPPWRFSALWRVSSAELTSTGAKADGLPDSMFADASAFVRHGYLVSRMPDGSSVRLAGDGAPFRGFHLPVNGGIWMGKLSLAQDNLWRIEDGLVAGRTPIDQVKRSLHEVGLCSGAGLDMFYESLMVYADENADLLTSGQNDPNAMCDAMSVGISFTASQVSPGMPGPIAPLVTCCPPGRSADQCQDECGDGKLSGMEACDTAIPDGQPGACPKTCAERDHCEHAYPQGMGCQAHCVYERINAFVNDDKCCPMGATAAQDNDCTASLLCGNGIVEKGETCDQPDGGCSNCPNLNSQCLKPSLTGSKDACTLACEYTQIKDCKSGDSCCPSGCNHDTDSDCPSKCGDGTVDTEAGETCEPNSNKPCDTAMKCEDDKNPCTDEIVTGSPDTCNVVCSHVPKAKPVDGDGCCRTDLHLNANIDSDCKPTCGNAVVEGSEECDDGNKSASDSCSNDCKMVNQQQRCLDAVGLVDECTKCICQNCLDVTTQCYDTPSAEQNMLCVKLARCYRKSKCTGADCYCANDLLNCEANPQGPCKDEVEAAAGTASLSMIALRSTDPQYALGRVNAVGQCGWNRCPEQCGQQGQ